MPVAASLTSSSAQAGSRGACAIAPLTSLRSSLVLLRDRAASEVLVNLFTLSRRMFSYAVHWLRAWIATGSSTESFFSGFLTEDKYLRLSNTTALAQL
eukprot:2355067-Amphidinium_carterae.1